MNKPTSAEVKARPTGGWRRLWTPRRAAPPAEFASVGALEDWMTDWAARKLGLPAASLGRDVPFTDLGLDSLAAVQLSGDLEGIMGRAISPSVAWEHPTIAELALYLYSAAPGDETFDMDL